MKIEILFIFLLISYVFSEPTFIASSIAEGTCSNGKYTFSVSGSLNEATSSVIDITPTFTSPTSAPTATCSLPITADEAKSSAAIVCEITSALSDATITVSAMTGTGVTVTISSPITMARTATCPANEPTTTFTASSIAEGTCSNGKYTFSVSGSLNAATTSAITITPTFTSPTSAPTVTCTLPITAAANIGSAAIVCEITSALSSATITVSAMTGTGVTVSGLPKTMTGTATCAGNAPNEPTTTTTFTASSIATGTCNDGVYTFKVSGSLNAATTSAITITPTFTSPTSAPTVTCTLPITAAANIGSAAIECKVTSALSDATITVSAMTGTGVTVSGLPKTMTGTATCAGKTDNSNPSSDNEGSDDDNAKFIQLSKFLMVILFFIF